MPIIASSTLKLKACREDKENDQAPQPACAPQLPSIVVTRLPSYSHFARASHSRLRRHAQRLFSTPRALSGSGLPSKTIEIPLE